MIDDDDERARVVMATSIISVYSLACREANTLEVDT